MNEAQVKSEAKVRGIVMQYRTFKIQQGELDRRLKRYRGMLKNLLPVLNGKWQDADGYARIEEYKETYSYPKEAVDRIIDQFEMRADEMEDLGNARLLHSFATLLRECRKPRKGYTTVKVK